VSIKGVIHNLPLTLQRILKSRYSENDDVYRFDGKII